MHLNPSSQINTNQLQFPEHEHLNCPRCDSNNTKFCYYNNYNLLQPRHYCRNCRRYWTKGGTLRKVPIGGGTRKSTKRSSTSNKRPADSSPSSSTATAPPPPSPAQLKPESSVAFDFDKTRNNTSDGRFNSLLRSNYLARSEGFVNDLSDGSEKTNIFPVNYLSVRNDRNQSGESSRCDGGGNGWPELSIFRSGSGFR